LFKIKEIQPKRILFSAGLGVITLIILILIINPFGFDFNEIGSGITGFFARDKTSNETETLSESLEETTSTTVVTTTSTTSVLTTTSPATTTIQTTSTSSTTTVPEADHVLLSEVLYDPPGEESEEEWIELYNPKSDSVDISGYTIKDNGGVYQIPNGTIIDHYDYLVIARNGTRFEELYGDVPDLNDSGLSLSNSGDYLKLIDEDDDEIDRVAWEGEISGWDLEVENGESIERDPPDRDTDSDDDWRVNSNPDPDPGGLITTTSTTTTTPGTTSTTTPATTTTSTTTSSTTTPATTTLTTTTIPTGPYIGEIMYDPPDPLDEWVEIISVTQVNMTNWNLTDEANHVYTFPHFILDGTVKVHTNTGVDNSIDLYWGSSQSIWNNSGDTATLIDNEGTVIDQKSY
jgi:hypothetical protein